MLLLKLLFLVGVFVLFYSYLGYGMLLWVLVKLKRNKKSKATALEGISYPPVSLIVAAYNEEDFIEDKIKNTLALDYPSHLLHIIFITDGSTDNTVASINRHSAIQLLHQDGRKGKVAAMHRAMSFVKTPIVIYSDANTLLNTDSVKHIVWHYQNPQVGGVAGEKKVLPSRQDAGAGEGLYWKYESFLKKLEWQFYTVVGAAGELFSIRTELYQNPGENILLDDFIISLRICQKGYRVAYEPNALATETASSSIKEEQKRKIRISAGAYQSMALLKELLNFFKYPHLSFQYISHRVLRWTLCPLFLPILLLTNIALVYIQISVWYTFFLVGQLLFYTLALAGWILYRQKVNVSFLYAPYYFVFSNYTLYLGFIRYLKGGQSVLWEKSVREKIPNDAGMNKM